MASEPSDLRTDAGALLLVEAAASTLCSGTAVGVGLYAYAAHGKWHLLVVGAVWLALSIVYGLAVTVFWARLTSYPRLVFRGLGDVIGVAALVAAFLLSLAGTLEGGVGVPSPATGEGTLSLWLHLRRREHLAVVWLLAPGIAGGLLAAIGVVVVTSLQLADGFSDAIDVGLLVVGVGIGLAAGYHAGSRKLLAVDRP